MNVVHNILLQLASITTNPYKGGVYKEAALRTAVKTNDSKETDVAQVWLYYSFYIVKNNFEDNTYFHP